MSSAEKTVMFTLPNLVSGQLACIGGTAAGRSWDLSAGTFTIGRNDEHDMALAAEPGVSKTHAKIIGQGDRYLIVDCESRNGTLVNGELVQKTDLYDGDEIRICGCTLRFTQKGGPVRPRRAAPPQSALGFDPPTAAFSLPPVPPLPTISPSPLMASPAPSLPPMPAMQTIAPAAQATQAPAGRVLATWYVGGLLGSLLLGGAASAALMATAPPVPAPAAPAAPEVALTTPPTPAPPPTTVAPPAATAPIETTPPPAQAVATAAVTPGPATRPAAA